MVHKSVIKHQAIKEYGGIEVCLCAYLTSTLDASKWSDEGLGQFSSMSPGPIQMQGWVGPRASMNTLKKGKISRPCRESNPNYSVVKPTV
jgi:hypothetical protein